MMPDVVDGCFALGYGDASAAFMGACMQLGFDQETCAALTVLLKLQ